MRREARFLRPGDQVVVSGCQFEVTSRWPEHQAGYVTVVLAGLPSTFRAHELVTIVSKEAPMTGTKITITSDLAVGIGRLAADHRDSAVTVEYDDTKAENVWRVAFEDGPDGTHVYYLDDQTGGCA